MNIAAGFVFLVALTGCNGHVYTVIKPSIPENQQLKGVIVYPPVNVIDLFKTTVLIEEGTGKILGSLDSKECVPDNKIKFSVRADFNRPMLVGYNSGLLEKNKFGVTLKDGMLVSVNSESDPSSALKDVAEIVPFFRAPYDKKPAIVGGAAKPFCNAGEKYLGTYLAPEFLPAEKLP